MLPSLLFAIELVNPGCVSSLSQVSFPPEIWEGVVEAGWGEHGTSQGAAPAHLHPNSVHTCLFPKPAALRRWCRAARSPGAAWGTGEPWRGAPRPCTPFLPSPPFLAGGRALPLLPAVLEAGAR